MRNKKVRNNVVDLVAVMRDLATDPKVNPNKYNLAIVANSAMVSSGYKSRTPEEIQSAIVLYTEQEKFENAIDKL